MQKLRIMSVVGARPNFMKIAPFVHAIHAFNARAAADPAHTSPLLEHFLVHTGQHYDKAMSESFFEALAIPKPDVDLGIGSGTHAEQVGRTMIAFEKVVQEWKPDWVIVVGDVNATCACSITAKKEHIRLAHIEAGLRSFDLDMPEEINRMVTDRLSDLLFTPDELSDENLRKEGVAETRIRRVGNIMIDTLEANRAKAQRLDVQEIIRANLLPVPDASPTRTRAAPPAQGYALLTMHRPSNVDERATLEPLVNLFSREVAAEMPLVWSLHPRTRKQLETFGLLDEVMACPGIHLIAPVGYHEMLRLNLGAQIMLTDSGGLQEECCVLGTPCVTLRHNTERPVTLRQHGGASELAGNNVARVRALFAEMKDCDRHECRPPLWDGRTAERIVEILAGAV